MDKKRAFDVYFNMYFLESYFNEKYGEWPNQFNFVARVHATNLNGVWRLCNTINAPWWKNKDVEFTLIPKLCKGLRSLSAGDCIRDLDNKKVYRVMLTGFSPECEG